MCEWRGPLRIAERCLPAVALLPQAAGHDDLPPAQREGIIGYNPAGQEETFHTGSGQPLSRPALHNAVCNTEDWVGYLALARRVPSFSGVQVAHIVAILRRCAPLWDLKGGPFAA